MFAERVNQTIEGAYFIFAKWNWDKNKGWEFRYIFESFISLEFPGKITEINNLRKEDVL